MSTAPPTTNAVRAVRVRGLVYVRRDDVRAYLLDIADDWSTLGECSQAAAESLREIAARLAKVTA